MLLGNPALYFVISVTELWRLLTCVCIHAMYDYMIALRDTVMYLGSHDHAIFLRNLALE